MNVLYSVVEQAGMFGVRESNTGDLLFLGGEVLLFKYEETANELAEILTDHKAGDLSKEV